ncbi:MAG: BspA family leucine-rich repeat surface protein [Prevotella sp.]|nr:BspA family leucine-rich repeat surface protein [Prevotella sp.]
MKIIKLCWQHSVRMMLAAVAIFLSLHAHAQQGYAVLSSDGKTLTFKYGTPTGTYILTDDTRFYWSDSQWGSNDNTVTKVVFDSSFASARPKRCKYWFNKMSNLTTISGIQFLNTSEVTDMMGMFNGCSGLTSLDVSRFNTGNVTDMQDMFNGCSSLKSLDVSKWNTGNVTDMFQMFDGCRSLTSLDVSKFNTSKVTNIASMFRGCSSLKSLDVSKWDTSNVRGMYEIFSDCSSLTSLDVSNWKTRGIYSLERMFYNCSKLTSLDLSKWDTSGVRVMFEMFYGCSSLTSLDLRSFNTTSVWQIYGFLRNCKGLKHVVFGKDFSFTVFSNGGNIDLMNTFFFNNISLRYADFYLSDHANTFTSEVVNEMLRSIKSTAVVYLPHGSKEVTGKQNVVYSYNGNQNDLRCPKYYSVDKVDIEFPRQFRTNEALYDRTATMDRKVYGSVILPFAFTSNSDIQAFALTKQVKQNGKVTGLTFTNVSTVAQHTPFAFQCKNKAEFRMKDNSGNFGITVYPVRSTNAAEKTWTVAGGAPEATPGSPYTGSTGLSNWKTKGYYVKETKTDYDGMYFIQDNYFKRAVGPLNLVDHRALFYPTGAAGAASFFSLSFVEEDMATAIEEAETEQTLSEATEIYDASGCRLSEARKGLNIIRMSDGTVKKVFIK